VTVWSDSQVQASSDTWIRVEEAGPVSVLTPMGGLDRKGNDALAKAIQETTAQNRCRILVNLRNVCKIGGPTVQVLLDGAAEAAKHGGDLRLLNAGHGIIRYLKNNRVFEQFEIYDDRGAAIADFLGMASSRRYPDRKKEPPPERNSTAEQQTESPKPELTQVLLSNSYMLATLIDILQEKKILTTDEVQILLERPDQSVEEGA